MDDQSIRERLEIAVTSGQLSLDDFLESAKLEQILDLDSLDHVELVMGFEEMGIQRPTVGDLIHLLERDGRREPPNDPPEPPMHPLPVTGPVETAGRPYSAKGSKRTC